MSGDPGDSPVHGSAWGLPVQEPALQDEALGVPEARRYEDAARIGAGGMGVVDVVYDARLDRQVARKRPRDGIPPGLAAALLAHEARVTARLDHPNVVPVHDAGIDGSGRPFVTLRLLPGRTLGDVLRDPQAPGRGRLVRHLLDAARGVAHAHERGVVHADLKPDNLLVGERGETWVADWGLARVLGEGGREPPVGEGAGTAPWCAPEVAAGGRPTPASDVYALGRVLQDVLVRAGEDAALAAVAARATGSDPASRYRDAGALADELERWLDGRPVLAHAYSPAQLAGLLVRAWRVPLGIGAVALLAVGIIATGAAIRTAAERDRAVAAEGRLTETVGSLWTDRAATALAAGRDREAVEAAREALAIGPSPRALGVVVAAGTQAVTLGPVGPWPSCGRFVRVSADGRLCGDGSSVRRLDWQGAEREVWALPATDAVAAPTGEVLALVQGRVERLGAPAAERVVWRAPVVRGLVDGGGALVDRVQWIDLGPSFEARSPCPATDTLDGAVSWGAGEGAVICSGGQVVRIGGGRHHVLAEHPGPLSRVTTLARTPDGAHLLAGTLDGEIVTLDATDGSLVGSMDAEVGVVRRIAVGALDGGVLALGHDGRARWLWPRDGVLGPSLPVAEVKEVGVDEGGGAWMVGPQGAQRVSVERSRASLRWREPAGISAAAIAPAGDRVAAGIDGGVVVRSWPEGRRQVAARPHDRVVKGLVFTKDGVVSGAVDETGALAVTPLDGSLSTSWPGVRGLRRVVGSPGGRTLALNYGRGLWLLPEDGGALVSVEAPTTLIDLVTPSFGSVGWGLDDHGALWTVDLGSGAMTRVEPAHEPPERRISVSADGRWMARSGPAGVRVGRTGQAPTSSWDPGAEITALAVDASGEQLALGLQDGRVSVWSSADGTLRWEVRAHDERVSALSWDSQGRLLSVGWDGLTRAWAPPWDWR